MVRERFRVSSLLIKELLVVTMLVNLQSTIIGKALKKSSEAFRVQRVSDISPTDIWSTT